MRAWQEYFAAQGYVFEPVVPMEKKVEEVVVIYEPRTEEYFQMKRLAQSQWVGAFGEPPNRVIFVAGIPKVLEAERVERHLMEVFGHFGEVESVRVVADRGCAFVVMSKLGEAAKAVRELLGWTLFGRTATLDFGLPPLFGQPPARLATPFLWISLRHVLDVSALKVAHFIEVSVMMRPHAVYVLPTNDWALACFGSVAEATRAREDLPRSMTTMKTARIDYAYPDDVRVIPESNTAVHSTLNAFMAGLTPTVRSMLEAPIVRKPEPTSSKNTSSHDDRARQQALLSARPADAPAADQLRHRIDKTAQFVARNAKYEVVLRARADDKVAFLSASDPAHAYYLWRLALERAGVDDATGRAMYAGLHGESPSPDAYGDPPRARVELSAAEAAEWDRILGKLDGANPATLETACRYILDRPHKAEALAIRIRQRALAAKDALTKLDLLQVMDSVILEAVEDRPIGSVDVFCAALINHSVFVMHSLCFSAAPDVIRAVDKMVFNWGRSGVVSPVVARVIMQTVTSKTLPKDGDDLLPISSQAAAILNSSAEQYRFELAQSRQYDEQPAQSRQYDDQPEEKQQPDDEKPLRFIDDPDVQS